MEILQKNLSDIHPYEKNPRKNDEAVQFVKNSIKEFGFKVPIIIDKDGVIVAGHTRYKAAQELEMKQVPVVLADDLSPEQVKAFRIADNKTAEKASWDIDLLKDELSDLLDDFNMSDFGFEEYELDLNDEYIDDFFDRGVEAKEKPVVYGVKVYVEDENQLNGLKQMLKEAGYNPEEL